jgi:D-xylose transport system permease protein
MTSFKTSWSRWIPLLTLVLVFTVFSFLSESFSTPRNLTNLIRQVSVNAILAFGMTTIILIGAIDLSIGSILALCSVVGAMVQVQYAASMGAFHLTLLSLAAVLITAILATSFSGFLISKFKIPAFVITLGVFVIARGVALIASGGAKISPLNDSYRWLGTEFISPETSLAVIALTAIVASTSFAFRKSAGKWLMILGTLAIASLLSWVFYQYQGMPVPVLAMLIVFAIMYFLLEESLYGRWVYAVGGNSEAARLSGIPRERVIFIAYLIMGILIALSSLIESGRINAGDPTAGNLYELDAIAAVVIGGTSLQGGVGRITGTLLGAILMGTINNGMSLLNVESNQQMVIKGIVIIIAVMADHLSKNHRS